ncbi:hypothetical protein [Halohasta salina]|uniref:hypothetical protein n=1 Tax=Halohasta salina TaxID=2961621 RepID=UPI0020A3E8FE|nr:hypothetical protein [Halohasta salina]
MNRYAPELALVAGALLGVVFGGFVLFSVGEFYSAVVVGAAFGYPFVAYAVHTDTDPTTVLPPRPVVAVGGLLGGGILVDVVRLFSPPTAALLFGLPFALGVVLPLAAYAARYGSPPAWLSPRRVEWACTVGAAGLLAAGIAAGAGVSGAVSALLVYVAGGVFAVRSAPPSRRHQRRRLVAGLVAAAGLVIVGVTTAGLPDPWVTAALAAVFGPLLVVALSAPIGANTT